MNSGRFILALVMSSSGQFSSYAICLSDFPSSFSLSIFSLRLKRRWFCFSRFSSHPRETSRHNRPFGSIQDSAGNVRKNTASTQLWSRYWTLISIVIVQPPVYYVKVEFP